MKKLFLAGLLYGAVGGAGLAIGHWLLAIPYVHVEHLTGRCVAVIPEDAGSCDNLPQKYNLVIVGPRLPENLTHLTF